jgi:ADP-ribose pyrophosphatase
VAVLPLHDDGTVTLVRQYRAPIDDDLLEIPAGIRDVDGEPRRAHRGPRAGRGGRARRRRIEHLVTFHNAPGISDEVVWCTWPPGCARSTRRPGGRGGGDDHRAPPLDDLAAMIADGRITDAKTVIGLTLVPARR